MNKIKTPISILEFGSACIKLCVYDSQSLNRNLFYEEKIDSKKKDKLLVDNYIIKLVKKAEKDLEQHLNEILLIIDSPSIHSIDISIQKFYDNKPFKNDDINYLINQCKQIIISNNSDKDILHAIISKINLDDKTIEDHENISTNVFKAEIDVKFIVINKKIYNDLKNFFIKEHISLKNIYCSSYIKSLGIIDKIGMSEFSSFIDIGLNKSSLLIFRKNKLLYINNTHVGGDHITKDISKVLNIDYRKAEAEKLKFSKKNKLNNNTEEKEILKKIINARLEEIVELLFLECPVIKNNIFSSGLSLFFTGNGSKVLNENMLSFGSDFDFINEMTIVDEEKKDCCDSAVKFQFTQEKIQPHALNQSLENKGFFEKLFEYFAKN